MYVHTNDKVCSTIQDKPGGVFEIFIVQHVTALKQHKCNWCTYMRGWCENWSTWIINISITSNAAIPIAFSWLAEFLKSFFYDILVSSTSISATRIHMHKHLFMNLAQTTKSATRYNHTVSVLQVMQLVYLQLQVKNNQLLKKYISCFI